METDWLNIDDRVGYVVKRLPDIPNVMRYHDDTRGQGRVPKLQEWISLVGERDRRTHGRHPQWACVVTSLNEPRQRTAEEARRVQFTADGDTVACRLGATQVTVNIHTLATRVEN
jgi:hypothetical protein